MSLNLIDSNFVGICSEKNVQSHDREPDEQMVELLN